MDANTDGKNRPIVVRVHVWNVTNVVNLSVDPIRVELENVVSPKLHVLAINARANNFDANPILVSPFNVTFDHANVA